jgi:uncharacterized protein (DUF2236 family)
MALSVVATPDERDLGLFGPDSVSWRLHADPVMLVGGMRALLVQALEPRAMAGVAQHSKYKEDPWGRLARTSEFVLHATYGTVADAEAACARVRAVHTRVHGIDPVSGRRYSATDPDLLLWIHAVEIDSFVDAYRAYAGRLSDADADRYVAEMAVIAEMCELPRAMAPRTLGEVREYLRGVTGLVVSDSTREALRVVLAPPMPAKYRPLWAFPLTAMLAILPTQARELYGLPWFPPATIPVRLETYVLSRLWNTLVPRPPVVRQARARAAQLAEGHAAEHAAGLAAAGDTADGDTTARPSGAQQDSGATHPQA